MKENRDSPVTRSNGRLDRNNVAVTLTPLLANSDVHELCVCREVEPVDPSFVFAVLSERRSPRAQSDREGVETTFHVHFIRSCAAYLKRARFI